MVISKHTPVCGTTPDEAATLEALAFEVYEDLDIDSIELNMELILSGFPCAVYGADHQR